MRATLAGDARRRRRQWTGRRHPHAPRPRRPDARAADQRTSRSGRRPQHGLEGVDLALRGLPRRRRPRLAGLDGAARRRPRPSRRTHRRGTGPPHRAPAVAAVRLGPVDGAAGERAVDHRRPGHPARRPGRDRRLRRALPARLPRGHRPRTAPDGPGLAALHRRTPHGAPRQARALVGERAAAAGQRRRRAARRGPRPALAASGRGVARPVPPPRGDDGRAHRRHGRPRGRTATAGGRRRRHVAGADRRPDVATRRARAALRPRGARHGRDQRGHPARRRRPPGRRPCPPPPGVRLAPRSRHGGRS